MLILLTNDILVIMPIPSVRMNLVDNPSPFITRIYWYSYCYERFVKGEGLTDQFFGSWLSLRWNISMRSRKMVRRLSEKKEVQMRTPCWVLPIVSRG